MDDGVKKNVIQDDMKSQASKASPTRTRIIILSLGVVFICVSLILLLSENTKTQDTRSRAQENEATVPVVLDKPVTDEQSTEVRVVSPVDNDVVMDPIKVEAEVGSVSVKSVEFWMDNDKEPFYTTTEAPYSIVVPDLRPGNHEFYVKVHDADGNIATSKEVTARVTPNSASLIKDKGEKE